MIAYPRITPLVGIRSGNPEQCVVMSALCHHSRPPRYCVCPDWSFPPPDNKAAEAQVALVPSLQPGQGDAAREFYLKMRENPDDIGSSFEFTDTDSEVEPPFAEPLAPTTAYRARHGHVAKQGK